eukprot:scaffold3292_cov101-Isochrysis_galbana.AAC.1
MERRPIHPSCPKVRGRRGNDRDCGHVQPAVQRHESNPGSGGGWPYVASQRPKARERRPLAPGPGSASRDSACSLLESGTA